MTRIFLFFIFCVNYVFAQDDFLTLPDVFDRQCKASYIESIERGEVSLDNLSSQKQIFWIVYSDRDDNPFYVNYNSSNKTQFKASFMQPFLVKQTKGNWLLLAEYNDEIEYGWMHAKNLLLSQYSLKTEGNLEKGIVSIPRKAIILTEIENAINDDGVMKSNKKYYRHPSNSKYENGSPKQFQALFVLKQTSKSVLLSSTDLLDGSPPTNKSKVLGWISSSDITPWDTRVALENAQSDDALLEYGVEKLYGYKTIDKLNLCLEQDFCDTKTSIAMFQVGPTDCNEMRRPIINNVNDNIKQVITILKDNTDNSKYKPLLEQARNLQQKVNIVFVIDATSSMKPYYQSIANSIEKIIDNNSKMLSSEKNSLRIGAVIYRDYADESEAIDIEPLTTNYKKVKTFISKTKCKSNDNDLPEAKFNGIINGINKVGFIPTESNIVVLIGDCGNHLDDLNKYDVNKASSVFKKYNANLISFQVKAGDDDTYYRFNEDVVSIISNTANDKIKGSKLTYNYKITDNNTIKLNWNKVSGKDDFENMFGLLVYSGYRPSSPRLLESTITETLQDYFATITKNINILTKYVYTGGPTGSQPPPGVVTYMMEVLGCSYDEAVKKLKQTEFTVEAFVALDYNGNNIYSQTPVVLLSDLEMNRLKKSLGILIAKKYSGADLKMKFQENIIFVCRSII